MEDTAGRMNEAVFHWKDIYCPHNETVIPQWADRDEQGAARNVHLLAMLEGEGKTNFSCSPVWIFLTQVSFNFR